MVDLVPMPCQETCPVAEVPQHNSFLLEMHGGMAQAIGWSLMEEEFMKDGKMRNHTFHDYLIPTAMDLPMTPVRVLDALRKARAEQ